MKLHGDAVLGFCVRLLRDRHQAEDVAQQVLLEACRDLDQFEMRSGLRAWLFGIAKNRCVDALRRQRRIERRFAHADDAVIDQPDARRGPAEDVECARMATALEQCLDQLAPDVRATVLARYQTDATYRALATEFDSTAAALQVRVARALPVLRRCLESKGWRNE